MSNFSKLTPEQKEQFKNCKSKEEVEALMNSFGILTDDQIASVAGGGYGEIRERCPHPDWGIPCESCPSLDDCLFIWHSGDSRDDVKPEKVSRAFSEGRISGADFFA